jgi:hypothetical protein
VISAVSFSLFSREIATSIAHRNPQDWGRAAYARNREGDWLLPSDSPVLTGSVVGHLLLEDLPDVVSF